MHVARKPWTGTLAIVLLACGSVAQQPQPITSSTLRGIAPEETVAEPLDGLVEVSSITDGDTFRVLSADGANEPVRMIGIDAPDRGDPMWEEASALLSSLIGGRTVLLVRDQSDRDGFGRLLRYVYVGDVFVNEAMVESGLAVAWMYEPDTSQADVLAEAQRRAEVVTTSSTSTSLSTPTTGPPVINVAPVTTAPAVSCHNSYSNVCLAVGVGDYDCAGGSGNGPNYVQGPVYVVGYDEFDLDREGDGVGCES